MKLRENNRTWVRTLIVLLFAAVIIVAAGAFTSHSARADQPTVKLSKTSLKLKQFDSKKLQLKNSEVDSVNWYSSNIKVATVDDNGLVQAVGGGDCNIIASYNGNKYTCSVKVTALELSDTSISLVIRRGTKQLSVNNKDLKKLVTWTSNDSYVASINSNGVVTPHNIGTTTVTCTYRTVTLSCTVRVLDVNLANLRAYRSPKNSANLNKLVLAGSGLLDHWGVSVYSAYGSTDVINNAIPHSTLANWKKWAKKLIINYKPKAVVLCIGSEDIGSGNAMTADQCVSNMKKILSKIRKGSKKTKIFVCSLPIYPDKPDSWPIVREVNETMRKYCNSHKKITYLNLNAKLVTNGAPIAAYFKADKYGLTPEGYSAIQKILVKKPKKAAK